MSFLKNLIITMVAALFLGPVTASANLLIYKGSVKQSAVGQGVTQKITASLYLVIDRDTANIAQIQYSTVGKTKLYSTTTSTNYHIVQITGPKGKNLKAIARLSGSGDTDGEPEEVLVQGSDTLLTISPGVTITFPRTLQGVTRVISSAAGTPTYIEGTLVASFDATQTPFSNANNETLDDAVARLSSTLEGQGYTQQGGGGVLKNPSLAITNDTMVTTWSDSFSRAQFGQRQNFFLGSYFVNYYPQYFISYRDHSRSGASNLEMLTNRVPMYGIPDAGASFGKTNGLNLFYVSGNGGLDSNTMYGLFKGLLQYPTNTYTREGDLVHDWSQSNPAQYYSSIVIGDIPYRGGSPWSRDYSYGGRSAAIEDGAPFVDSWANLVSVVTNADVNGPNLWFNAPFFDHPGNEIQLVWALTTLRSLGVDTNTYTAVIDFNSAKVSQTNHCTVTGLVRSGSTLSFTFHADRMAPGFYVPDDVITNDCRGAFALMPALGNQFCEILKVSNLPAGNYELNIDGSNVVTITSAQLAAGYNGFTNYSGPFWAQKKEVLGLMCDMLDVLRSDAATDAHPADNLLMERYESYARARWSTNNFGVDPYIAQMSDREMEIQAQDVLIHAAAQQTNHIFTLTQISSPSLAIAPNISNPALVAFRKK